MIVDDEPDVLLTFSMILQGSGFYVEAISSADDALTSINKNAKSYCLALIDLELDRVSGINLARTLRAQNGDVSIVLVTAAESHYDEVKDALEKKIINGVIRKPVGNKNLVDLAERECGPK